MTSKELQCLKYQRLSEPEKIVLESFKGLKEYIHSAYPDCIFLKSDLDVFYKYDIENGWLEYDYELIYKKIESYFDSNEQVIDEFVQWMIEKYIKLNIDGSSFQLNLNEVFSLKYTKLSIVEKHLKIKL